MNKDIENIKLILELVMDHTRSVFKIRHSNSKLSSIHVYFIEHLLVNLNQLIKELYNCRPLVIKPCCLGRETLHPDPPKHPDVCGNSTKIGAQGLHNPTASIFEIDQFFIVGGIEEVKGTKLHEIYCHQDERPRGRIKVKTVVQRTNGLGKG